MVGGKMRHVRIVTSSGYSWESNINGTDEEVKKYYMGKYFDIGNYPHEKMDKVTNVIIIK